jgi:hypothetical protein
LHLDLSWIEFNFKLNEIWGFEIRLRKMAVFETFLHKNQVNQYNIKYQRQGQTNDY